VLGVIVVLDLLWIFAAGHALNKFASAGIIERELRKKTVASPVLSGLKFKPHPDFSLSANAEKINIVQDGKTIIDAQNIHARIKILPLIFNKLYVNSVLADKITVNIVRSKNGKINLLELFPEPINTKDIPDIKRLKVNVKNYDISYRDEAINYNAKLSGDYFNINELVSNKKINFDAAGSLISEGKTAKFHADITSNLPVEKNLSKDNFNLNLSIQNLDLAAFSALTKYLKNSEITGLDGKINAEIKTTDLNNEKKVTGKIQSENFIIHEKLPENSTYLKEKANINFDTKLISNSLVINNFTLKTIYHDLKMSGEIDRINTSKPVLDLRLALHNDIKSMIYTLVPSEIEFENYMLAKIKKYKPKATVDGEITIKGDALEPDIEGEFHTDNLFIDLPVANEAKAKLKLIFLKDKLHVLSDVVPNTGTFVKVDGLINIYGTKSAVFDIESGKNVKLTVTRAVLIPIQDTFSLNFGILNHLFVEKGNGDAKLHIDGTRADALVDGRLNFYNGTAFMDGLDTKVENISGYLNFKGKNADFSTTTATINGDKVKISGKADLFGAYDINIDSDSIKTNTLVNLLKNSPILKPAAERFKEINKIKNVKGLCSVKLNAKGKMDDMKALVNLSDMDYNGSLNIKNNEAIIEGVYYPLKIRTAAAKFNTKDITAAANTQILNSPVNIDAEIKGNAVKLYAVSNKFRLRDLIILADKKGLHKKFLSQNPPKNASFVNFKALYDSKTKDIDLNKLSLNANLFHDSTGQAPKMYATGGSITLKNGNADIKKLNLTILNSVISVNGAIKNVFARKPDYNIDCTLKNFDVASLNNFSQYKIFGADIKKILGAYEDYKGTANGALKLRKSGLDGKISLKGIGFTHKKMQMPFYINNADLIFKNDTLALQSMNAAVDNVPVFMNLKVGNVTSKPLLQGYVTSNIYPSFVNKYVNANLGYPIKLKGEMRIKSYFNGTLDAIKSSTTLNFPIGSNISYMGASLDEEEFEREIKADLIQNKNRINILNAGYLKYIPSQNGTKTKYPYINASGKMALHHKYAVFDNFKIKTSAKTGSKFLNILFKKSVLKYGDFECDLNINGSSLSPSILGFIKFRNLDMPLYETVVRDIFADFTQNKIALKILGNVYDTNITAIAALDNRLSMPYRIRNVEIKADYLDLDTIFDSISKVTMQTPHAFKAAANNELLEYIEPTGILIDKGIISAKKILIKGFPATDLQAQFKQGRDNILRIDNFDFTIAEGTISANGYYDFKNKILSGDCIAKSIDANQFSQIFLNFKNQIFGALDGTVNFSTQGSDPIERIKNLKCKVAFIIQDGKMPKLGSLEYLLRAGNVIKSGITGFTINNIIELLVPIKTGDFSIIRGDIHVQNGVADNIKLYTKGKNLSLYITGRGDLLTQNSNMVVYGRLSKKVSTLLGPIGNTSLNTLFNLIPGVKITEAESSVLKDINKIPGLEFSSDEYRFFSAEIDGDINGENYVKSFKWLE